MKSILSFPDRGKWGNPSWRGNCSGHVIRELIEHFQPKLFVDVCEGGGTSRDVCEQMGVEYFGFDLHGTKTRPTATDFTADYVKALLPRPADLCFSHPPYHDMIDYRQIGQFRDPSVRSRDTSACKTVEEFLEKSHVMLANQREATREGGIYATLIGDMRRRGTFRSFQADFIGMMPADELHAVVVKLQHNCMSDNRTYSGSFVPILHEYLVVWKKTRKTLFMVSLEKAMELQRYQKVVWRTLLRGILMQKGGTATLREVYEEVQRQAPEYVKQRPHWMEKVRQELQKGFDPVSRGVWGMEAAA